MILDLIFEQINFINGLIIDLNDIPDNDYSKYIQSLCYNKIFNINDVSVVLDNDEKIINIITDNGVNHIDFKFFNNSTKLFNISNIISIDKIRKLLFNNTNNIIYVIIKYTIDNNKIKIDNIDVKKIENFNWDNLTIQNLGKGQLQFKNTSITNIYDNNINRQDWLNRLKNESISYYDKMILRITEYKMEWE